MSEARASDEALTPVKRALLEIRELKSQLAQARGALHDPIAITGMAMRLPGGVVDAEGFAELLWSGTDAIGNIPAQRWSLADLYSEDADEPGKMTTRFGGFLEGVDQFDAEFFGISPREAATMDPQQRLLLEVAWEAIENAGQAPGGLAGTRTGVYLGISNSDYGRALFKHPELIDPYFSTGTALSVASGRLSYFLGLHGPSVSVDTACSSSLVALHQACQGLRLGECDSALVGAVNLILTPELNINFSKARMMAADGRCKTFDAAADGYVRGEGCAVLVLKRLSRAQADGDRVLAVVRGSALNQDGRSGGLTAPNGPAQEAVVRAALAAAQVAPADIGYVEAHGTGTSLGDPIEVGALGAVLAEGRAATQPLLLGSVKTNIGHLEAAAGLAGVIKVVLALQRGEVPPHLHFKTGNPHIDWASWPVKVPTTTTPWPAIGGRRLAGVSSFGFSGTNAHVILEQAPMAAPSTEPARPLHVLALSARDDEALAQLAQRYEAALQDGAPLADLCFTANAGRTHFAHRLAVVGATAQALRQSLVDHRRGQPHGGVATGVVEGAARPQVAFLFTGQGAQHAGMARGLYDRFPVFRAALDDCAARLVPLLDRGLIELLFAPADHSPINEMAYAQPANFAVEYALAILWQSFGVEPVAVLGHSLGEYAAACVAGVMSLDDALRLVTTRGRLMHALPADGAMAAVFAPQPVVEDALMRQGRGVTLGAFNGPEHFVITGARGAVEAAVASFEASGVKAKLLRVPHAAHSSMVDPVLPELRQALQTVRFSAPRVTLVSNLTGHAVGFDEVGTPDYWVNHMRQPVRFAQAMQVLQALGITHYIEIGPHPVLLGMGAECVSRPGVEWLPSLRRDRADGTDLAESLQRLYVGGADIDWAGLDSGQPRRRLALPLYPFQRRRHWMDVVNASQVAPVHPGQRWAELSAALQRQSERGPLNLNAASYPAKWDCLARVTTAHMLQLMRSTGVFAQTGIALGLDEVMARAGIGSSYRHLVQRGLARLTASGFLRSQGSQWVADAPLPDPGLPALLQEAEDLFADNRPLLDYVRHCGSLVTPVLTGRESPLETLFPGGSFELARGLYERSSTMLYINALAASAFEALSRSVLPGRQLRVLEVGAGTGGTSSALLKVLTPERTRYCFSDVSDLFLNQARERFADYPFVDFRLFDMERDPAEQGYAPQSFDAIVSANAVHASTDLRLALQRLRGLLAPGGVLVLVESTTHLEFFDMTTGLIEGWQHFADDLRGDNPLLPPQRWISALREAGFDEAGAWPEAGSLAEHLGQHVIVARVPGLATGGEVAAVPVDASSATLRPTTVGAASVAPVWRTRLDEAVPAERLDLLRELVRSQVMAVLRLDAGSPPSRHDRLMDLGMDSLMAVQLRNALGKALALDKPLPSTLMFDHPTIDAMAAYLLERVAPAAAAPTPTASTAASTVAVAPAPERLGAAAVAGMSDDEIAALLMKQLGGA